MKTKDNLAGAGRAIAVLWAAFWCFFAIASVASERPIRADGLLIAATTVLILAGSAARVFYCEHSGGILLTVEGIALCAINSYFLHNPPAAQLFLLVTLCMPPILSGLLLLKPWNRTAGVSR